MGAGSLRFLDDPPPKSRRKPANLGDGATMATESETATGSVTRWRETWEVGEKRVEIETIHAPRELWDLSTESRSSSWRVRDVAGGFVLARRLS